MSIRTQSGQGGGAAARPLKAGPRKRANRGRLRLALCAAGATVPLGYSLVAGAATKNWIAGSGAWTASGNWSTPAVPVAGDIANVFNTGGVGNDALVTFDNYFYSGAMNTLALDATNGGSITLQQNSGFLSVTNELLAANGVASLYLTGGSHVSSSFYAGGNPFGGGYGGTAQINQSGGSLSVQNTLFLGYGVNADATMVQSGGSVTAGSLTLASGANSRATYTLNGPQAALTISGGGINLNGPGVSSFNLVQGQVTVSGPTYVSSGTMNLSGGALQASSSYVTIGNTGSGVINQTGGATAFGYIAIRAAGGAVTPTATAAYNLTDGTVSSGGLLVDGAYNQSGGTHTCSGAIIIGNTPGGTGTFNLSGGAFTETPGYGPWTIGVGGLGTFNQTNGITTAGTLLLGTSYAQPGNTANPFAFGTGRVNLSGGALTLATEEIGSHGAGEFVQTGGSHAVSSLTIGGTANPESTAHPTGSYALSGGTLQATVERVGFNTGAGTFIQTGGTHLVTGSLTVGSNATGTYSLGGDGSTLAVGGDEQIGGAGVGAFVQSGGAHSVGGQLTVGGNGTGAASFSLQGGTLAAGSVLVGPAGTFSSTGGTLSTNAFTLAGGTVTGTLRNVGTFTYQAGSFAAQLVNIGTFNLQGGAVSAPAIQVNAVGGAINGWGRIDGPLNNVGSLNATGALLLGGSVTNAGSLNAGAGSSLVAPGPVLNTGGITLAGGGLLAGGAVTNAGVLTLSGGAGVSASGDAGQLVNAPGGTLQGGGNVALPLVNHGTIFANDLRSPLTLANLPANAAGAQLQVAAGSTLSLSAPLDNLGTFRLLGTGAQATGAPITNDGTLRGAGQVNNTVQNNGVLRAENGELDLAATDNTNAPTGHIQASGGNAVVYLQGLANNAGAVELSGGSFDNNGAALTNSGSVVGNGTLRTGGLLNNGTIALVDVASSVYGPVTNTGSLNLTNNTTTFYGFVNNATGGTIKTTAATARYLAGASVGGTYISDPSTQYFTDLSVTASGALQGGAGDQFIVTGSYASSSSNSANWNTSGALLRLTGGGTHAVTVTGTGGPAFAWGQLQVDAPDIAVVSGSGTAGGFQAIGTANAGSIQQPSGVSNLGALTGGGSISVGGPGATAVTSVTGFTQNAVTVADGGKLQVLKASTVVTNTASALTLNGSGTLDLSNHRLMVNTSDSIRTYVAHAAGAPLPSSLNPWTGPGLTSSVVQADAAVGNAKQLALGYFDSRDNGNTGLNVPAGQTLVRTTVYGDATGDGKVSIADLSVWNNNFGASNPRWSQGDFNYDGKVNIADLSVWNNDFGNNVNNTGAGPTARGAAAAVSAAVTLTAAASTATAAAPSSIEMDVYPNGDVQLVSGGITLAALEVDSNAGNLIPANWTSLKSQKGLVQWSNPRGTPNANEIAEFVSDPTAASGQPVTLAAGSIVDYGNILPANFTNGSDLTFTFNQVLDTVTGTTASGTGNIVFVNGVPEPASLGLIGVAAVGLLGRRRRRR